MADLQRLLRRHLGLVVLCCACIAIGDFCHYADSYAMVGQDAIIQISPTKQRIELVPGQVYTGTFAVQNPGQTAFDFGVAAMPYSVINEQYSADFSTFTNYTQIAKWITLEPTSGTVQPGASQTISYTITVPNDVPSGGQYASLMAYSAGGDDSSGVQITSRVGMLLYASVAGNTREEGAILDHKVKSFFLNEPLATELTLENTGNIDATATVTLSITDFFSDKLVYSNADRPSIRTVLPETTRYDTLTWAESPRLGFYRVSESVDYVGDSSNITRLVLVCPLWLMLAVAAFVVLLIIFIILTVIHHCRKKRRRNDPLVTYQITSDDPTPDPTTPDATDTPLDKTPNL